MDVVLKGFTHARLSCGCKVGFKPGDQLKLTIRGLGEQRQKVVSHPG